MFAPHHAVDAHFGEVRRAAEVRGDGVEFLRSEAHFLRLGEGRWRGGCLHGDAAL